jgi:hypothetical protein
MAVSRDGSAQVLGSRAPWCPWGGSTQWELYCLVDPWTYCLRKPWVPLSLALPIFFKIRFQF